jgi:hypothetical protein
MEAFGDLGIDASRGAVFPGLEGPGAIDIQKAN